MTAEEWVAAFAAECGVAAPTAEEFETLLAVAGVAAHASARTAAPITSWLSARAGLSPGDALALAERLAARP